MTVFLLISSTAAATVSFTTTKGRHYTNPTGDDFPILAYSAFRPEMTSLHNFKVLRECGANMAQSWLTDTSALPDALRFGEETGIKILVNIEDTRHADRIPAVIDRYGKYPATAGYLLWDEPVLRQFKHMGELIEAVLNNAENTLAYVNLLPNYAAPKVYGTQDYREYLEQFIEIANPQFLSYDNYCILEENGILKLREGFFENLEIARDVTQKYNMPLWTFCLSTAHYSYPVPDVGQLLFEAFSGLSYGSKAIQYFTYASKTIDNIESTEAPVAQDGKRRKAWYAMQKANRQIQTVGRLLLPCKSVGVWHTGAQLPKGTRELKSSDLPGPFTSVVSQSAGVVVSHHTDGHHNYLLIVNKDFEHRQTVRIAREGSVRRILPDGKEVLDRTIRQTLKPGSWLLYMW